MFFRFRWRGFAYRIAPVFLILALLAQPASASAPEGAGVAPVPGRLTVAFSEKGLSEARARALLARHGASIERWLPGLGLARVVVPFGRERALARVIAAGSGIAYAVEERESVEIAAVPLDERWADQWGPDRVGLPAALDITRGRPSTVIAVIDTGVNYRHWDLRGQMWMNPGESDVDPATGERFCDGPTAHNGLDDDDNGYVDDCLGYNFASDSADPIDEHGHGTAVAGIAGAATDNAGSHTDGGYEGIAGMGGFSRLMAVRALNASGYGSPFNIAEAIRYAADSGASVINLSLTLGVNYDPGDAATLCAATAYAEDAGVLVVGASGNHSAGMLQPVSFPAACPGVVAVGASTADDLRAYFSDGGDRLDLVAPGVEIVTTLRDSNIAYGLFGYSGSGTSFAAPHVSGAAALVRGLRPDLRQEQVRDLLRQTADDVVDPGPDPLTGSGRLNVARALQAASEMPRQGSLISLPFVSR
jgi:subtilisin family serine protease